MSYHCACLIVLDPHRLLQACRLCHGDGTAVDTKGILAWIASVAYDLLGSGTWFPLLSIQGSPERLAMIQQQQESHCSCGSASSPVAIQPWPFAVMENLLLQMSAQRPGAVQLSSVLLTETMPRHGLSLERLDNCLFQVNEIMSMLASAIGIRVDASLNH
jgi:hypothetical protein